MVVRRIVGMLALGLWLGLCQGASAQSAPAQSRPSAADPEVVPGVEVSDLPISVDRIERRLSNPSPITLEVTQPMFRVEVVETRPRWISEIQWVPPPQPGVPVAAGPAWHRDFLDMVTPQLTRPFGQASGWDLLQLFGTSVAENLAANAIIGKLQGSAARRASKAREEVDAAIEAWKQEREAASAAGVAPATREPASPDATPGTAPPPATAPPR